MKAQRKNLALMLLVALIFVYILYLVAQTRKPPIEELPYSSFLSKVRRGYIAEVTIEGSDINGRYNNKKYFHTTIPYNDPDLITTLVNNRVKVFGIDKESKGSFFSGLFNILIILLPLILIWNLFFRQSQGGPANKVFSFGRSKAKLFSPKESKVTFTDVAGIDEAKEEVEEIIDFLKDPKKFTKLGARIPKGCLLVGAPGTGKTLLARAIAGEAGVPFFTISGSDFVEMFVGVGASRVRDLFERGKRSAPCIIFIDEIDAVGRYRGAGIGGGHDEREQTLNALLVEMDGFNSNKGIIIIAATNRPDVLDNALLRPGRFDRQIVIDMPDMKGRELILKVHARGKPLEKKVDLSKIARGTPGFTGADLENLVNEAALIAARRNKKFITHEDFEFAKDKILMGPERKSIIISEKEKKLTAYHEAGHALLSKLLKNTDPVHKVTIIPRGRALGLTQHLPEDEKHNFPKEYWLDNLVMMMGGRAAEELKFHSITTGAKNDIEKATEIATRMVREWGMSEKIGPLSVAGEREHIFLGREIAQHRDYSEETARIIDQEIKKLIMDSQNRARKLLKQHHQLLDTIAIRLLEKESLDGAEINNILKHAMKKTVRKKKRSRA
ncbi:MAG: ATP-dependent zinc metalloprotease FtsH [Spirochaetes bacterium]|nr:ATP-dependent zinc metalloprotease FtsH [Spirochaetota bacterium]